MVLKYFKMVFVFLLNVVEGWNNFGDDEYDW